jgi:hypothetical protein
MAVTSVPHVPLQVTAYERLMSPLGWLSCVQRSAISCPRTAPPGYSALCTFT